VDRSFCKTTFHPGGNPKVKKLTKSLLAIGIGTAVAVGASTGAVAADPKSGGVLNFVVGSKIPTYDGHAETTFGMIHPIRPFYSLLFRVNPDNPESPIDFVCDVCEGKVSLSGDEGTGGKQYTYNIRKNIKFHDGTALTAHDVVATFQKIVFPPDGVRSSRKAFFGMVDTITATDDYTVQFKLKYPSGAFVGAVGMPFNFIYAKKDIERKDPEGKNPLYGMNWHKKNVNGTGAFSFVQHQPGAFVEGKKFADYHHEGKPYLDGFKAISAPKMANRVQAIRGDRAAIEFRGFPPKQRDSLIDALGKEGVTVQTSDWNCSLLYTLNEKDAQFKDARVRRALNLSVDRWKAQTTLSKIAIVKTAGGIVFPSHPLAASKEELMKLDGLGSDIKAARSAAKALLKAAGKSNLEFTLNNRGVDQPYRYIATWLIGEWKKIGVKVKQNVVPTAQWFAAMRSGKFEATTDANCQSIVNPLIDVSKYLPGAPNNRSHYEDPEIVKLFEAMNREATAEGQRKIMREYERMIINGGHAGLTLWWNKINPHRSYVKGWKIAPSHYLNQHLDQVWLDRS
jgi:peptide/nickel transport system substrate-binding protein